MIRIINWDVCGHLFLRYLKSSFEDKETEDSLPAYCRIIYEQQSPQTWQ